MKRHNQKRGFTVVELVIIIAVVAILAAVLIPTYVHLVKKSHEADAQIEDKTLISEMLTEILLGDKDSADLLVFSKKGDGVYLLGYCAEQQKFLTYRNNPIALTTDMETTVQAAVGKLLAEGVIKQNPDVDNEKNPNDWRLEKNVKTIVGNLNSKYDVVVYANYLINDDLFVAHVHTWETAWTFDGTHHWHKCIGCDEVSGKAEHVYDADGKCVCGAVKTTPAHTHLFDKKNVADKYRKSAADCTHPAVYYFSCACGEVGAQTFEDGTALGHNFGAGNVTTQPTCTSQGIMTYTCTRDGCDAKNTVSVPALGHTYGANGKCIRCGATKPTQGHTHKYSEVLKKAATCTTPAEYQLVCSCGEIGSQTYTKGTPLGHAWDAGKVTKPATCTAAGVKTFTCTRCKTTKTEAVPTLAHTPVVVAGKEATCTETGLTEGKKCSVCGKVLVEQTVIPVKEHTPVVVHGKEATCTETGLTEGKKCSVCGKVLVEQTEIPVKEHTPVVVAGKEATCTETGLTEGKKCSVCGTVIVAQEIIPAKGHTPLEGPMGYVAGKEATCTEPGLTAGRKCAYCNELIEKQEVIPALGHDKAPYGASFSATCDREGNEAGEWCRRCQTIFVQPKTTPKLGHNMVKNEGEEDSPATCTAEGWVAGTHCTRCNKSTPSEKLPMLTHTCDDSGKCTVCGKSWQECVIDDLQKETAGAKEVKLLGDLTITSKTASGALAPFQMQSATGETITINLNGHTLTVDADNIAYYGNIVISGGGKIVYNGNYWLFSMRDSGLTVTVGAGTTVVDSNGTALIPEAICEGKANLHYFVPGTEGHNFGDDGKCRSCYKTKEELGLA